MGRRLAGRTARQRPHLNESHPSGPHPNAELSGWVRNAVLAVLTFDGLLSAIVGAFLLPLYLGGFPLPISGLLSGLMNAALVWVALMWAPTPRIAALPLWAWLAATMVLTLGGPGNDIVLSGAGIFQLAPILFVVLGAGPPAYVLWRLTSRVEG